MATGKLVWETPVLDPKMRAPTSGGPIVANGKVITGRQCQPDATRDSCVVTAHDAKTGKELWRFHTIPGPGEPGDESWGGVPMNERWHVGTWMVPSYDPELNLVIIGTSVTIPAPKFTLAGADKQYLFHNCTLAINADTGKLVWYYQHIVDHWDLDHPFERLLVDTAVAPSAAEVRWINPKVRAGERRKVVTGIPGKTGVVYTLDRATGEFLWARPTVQQNVISNIDGSTGKVIVNPEVVFTKLNDERFVCPGSNGGKNWPAGAYSPLTNTMYMPLQNLCMTATTTTDQRDPSKVYGINMKPEFSIGADKVGTVWAIAADTGKTTWKHEQRAGTLSLDDDGRRARDRRRRERPVQGARRQDRPGAVGDDRRLRVERLSDLLRGQRQAVRRDHHRAVARGEHRRSDRRRSTPRTTHRGSSSSRCPRRR